jgi:hypothetical protein
MSSSTTKVTKLNLIPGIDKNTTELDSEGTYVSCDKIRFFYGKPEKLGGWQKEIVPTDVLGTARDIHTWVDLTGQPYLAFGTNVKLYNYFGGDVHDITPIRASACADDALNTTAGSPTITVSVNPEGALAGDYFVFAEVTACVGDGAQLTSTYEIASVDAGHFTFLASTTAAATSANAGGVTRVDFLLETGLESNGAAFGWGAGTWGTPGVSASGSAGWSKPRGGSGVSAELRQWSLDNYGEDLLASPRGGKIYRWEASAGIAQRAQVMSSAAPSVVNIMQVAQDGRHVVAAGTHNAAGEFDPMLVRWSDSENFNDWTASAGNQAGSFRLENGSEIIGIEETRREIVVFTDESLYSMQRIGGDFVFSFKDMGTINGLISQHGSIDIDGVVFWMGFRSFQYYDGVVRTLPCTVQNYIFDPDSIGSINQDQKEKVFCATNREFNEIWWLYPSKGSDENDRYVIYNYLEKTWYIGTLDRTVWHDVDIFDRPFALDPDGELFIHEQGKDDDTAGMKAELLTSFIDIDDGDELMFLDRYIPDLTLVKEVDYLINYKKYPQSNECFTKGPYTITPTTTKFHPRIRGRQMQVKYSTSVQGADFRVGSDRIALKPDGKR